VAAVAAAAAVASATRSVRFHAFLAMGWVYPRRALIVAVMAIAGCSAKHHAPALAVPQVETGRAGVRAIRADSLGPVELVAVAVTNGLTESIRVDGRQAFALTESGERIASLPAGEAARLARGRGLPDSLSGAGKGAVTGGVLGAMGGAISGAIQGGIGGAVGAGAAVGVGLGAITGALGGGGGPPPDVAGFTERALPATSVAPGLSTTGYLYYPEGSYETLELLLTEDASGRVMPERVPIVPDE